MNANEISVLRYPDADWNVSGLFTHDRDILYFYDVLNCYGEKPFTSVHGCIPCAWNSGRIIRGRSERYIGQCIEAYAQRNIPVFLTFSNYLITEELLCDGPSNRILEQVARYRGNGVIISSPLLREYIKGRYPDLFQSSSILYVVNEQKQGDAPFYHALASQYDRVVLHPDDGFNIALLQALSPKEKFEIILNENCVRGCAMRKQHCDIVCAYYSLRREPAQFDHLNQFKAKHCKSLQDKNHLRAYLYEGLRNCNMTYDEVRRCYDYGYRCFKLQGRSGSAASLLYDLTRYTLKEDAASKIYKIISDRLPSAPDDEELVLLDGQRKNWQEI